MTKQLARRQQLRRAALLVSLLLFPITLNYLSPYVIINGASQGIINGSFIYYFVVGTFVGLAWAFGRRAGCHYICWMAPFMILGRKLRNLGKWPALHLRAEPEKCTSCLQCTKACPMSLAVNEMVKRNQMENCECILCGNCIDGCARKVIHYAVKAG